MEEILNQINETIGNNKLQISEHSALKDNLVYKIQDLTSHSDVVVISKKDPDIIELVEANKEIIFIDLVRIKDFVKSANYEGICW